VAIEAHGDATISRLPEDVFDVLAESPNEPRWLPGALSVEKTSAGPVGPGTTFVGSPPRAMRLVTPLTARTMRRRFAANRAHLAPVLEQRAP
jgi:hypothetical protein